VGDFHGTSGEEASSPPVRWEMTFIDVLEPAEEWAVHLDKPTPNPKLGANSAYGWKQREEILIPVVSSGGQALHDVNRRATVSSQPWYARDHKF
jgi:hypothetical protein